MASAVLTFETFRPVHEIRSESRGSAWIKRGSASTEPTIPRRSDTQPAMDAFVSRIGMWTGSLRRLPTERTSRFSDARHEFDSGPVDLRGAFIDLYLLHQNEERSSHQHTVSRTTIQRAGGAERGAVD